VSSERRDNLDSILRQSAFAADSDVNEQRRQFRELLSAQPLPADVTVTAAALGGVPTAEAAALDRAGQRLSACLTGAECVTLANDGSST
jgi:hypothetical protein